MDSNQWETADITGTNDWGVELVTGQVQFGAINICVNVRSGIREQAFWLVSIHGNAFTEFTVDFVPKMMIY